MGVLNRKVDAQIITELGTTTSTITISGTPTVDAVQHAQAKLQAASVPWDSNITLLCQPAFLSYIEQAPEFAKATYVNMKPYAGEDQNANWRDVPMAYRWKNMLIVAHPNLPAQGTTAEVSYMYHKSSIGHAADKSSLSSAVGYDDEQDYSFARATMYMGAKLLQNSGVVEIVSDGSART